MPSDKPGVNELAKLCKHWGMETVIISPGSRNAPFIITFAGEKDFQTLSIVDERSAAFFALGIAQQTSKPVGLICTSGSALLNYAPAIAEAYYQKISLIVISADRPKEWIDQGDGQTIRQENIFANYIRYSCQIPAEFFTDDDKWYANRKINEAFSFALHNRMGPVHINMGFREPLYHKKINEPGHTRTIHTSPLETKITPSHLRQLAEKMNTSKKVMMIAGMMQPKKELSRLVNQMAENDNITVLTERTSNLSGDSLNPFIDRILFSLNPLQYEEFQPELLITFGEAIVSKMIKKFLRENPPKEHWHISSDELHLDTYQHLTENIPIAPEVFFEQLAPLLRPGKGTYKHTWLKATQQSNIKHDAYLKKIPWSDFQVFDILYKHLPEGCSVQLANSTPVRYAQLFSENVPVEYFSNRGTSGIDGCTSTAAGAAYASEKLNILITGDLAFFYDSNALWNPYLTSNLRIIVINNGGGGIFRFIPGPSETGQLEEFFEASHTHKAKYLAKTFGISYCYSTNKEQLEEILPSFFGKQEKPVILEIQTPQKENAKILTAYFNFLKNES